MAEAAVTDQGTQNGAGAEWRAALPADLRTEIESMKAGTVLDPIKGKDWTEAGPQLVKGFIHAQRKLGERTDGMVKVPGKDAPAEEIAAYRKATGVPDAPEGYALTFPEVQGVTWRPDAKAVWGKAMHEAGIAPAAAQRLVEVFAQDAAAAAAAQRTEWKAGQDKLKGEWGEATYRQRAHWAEQAVDHFFGADFKKMLDVTGYGDHPLFFHGMWKIGQGLQEDGLITGTFDGGPGDESGVDAEMAKMRDDKSHPLNAALMDRSHPNHAKAAEVWEALVVKKGAYIEARRRQA